MQTRATSRQAGLSLIEILLALTIGSFIMLTLAALNVQVVQQLNREAVKGQVDLFRRNLMALVLNDSSWNNSKLANQSTGPYPIGTMDCLVDGVSPCPTDGTVTPPVTLAFALIDANNKLYYDATNPNQGIDTQGNPCTTFVPPPGQPTDQCLFRFQLEWTANCASCINPSIVMIRANLIQNINGPIQAINPGQYSLPPLYRAK